MVKRAERVALIGLDCVTPQLLFGKAWSGLPNLRALADRGIHGELESVTPPITVPAWMCMMTSRDPGALGVYGFRNRADHSYEGLRFASSRSIQAPALWDAVGAAGGRSILIGVPPSYPPKRLNGFAVSCFLTPDGDRAYTYPPSLQAEVERASGGYVFDVRDFRRAPKDDLLEQLYAMMRKRFAAARCLAQTHRWDLLAAVSMAPDRLHHAFWRYFDPEHRLYEPGNPYENAARDFYREMDAEVGRLLEVLGEETAAFVVSDHGAQRMEGGICLNEWLIQNKYLTLKESPPPGTPFDAGLVDWDRTLAWGSGGYYGRIFLNVKGREPRGAVAKSDMERVRDDLIAGLESLGDDSGKPIGTRARRPEELYSEARGIAPDLMAEFGGLGWRSVGSVGSGQLHVFENDTGPDDANHAMRGVLIAAGPGIEHDPSPRLGMSLLDVAPTALELLGLERPEDAQGSGLLSDDEGEAAFTEEDEAKIAARLEELGYL